MSLFCGGLNISDSGALYISAQSLRPLRLCGLIVFANKFTAEAQRTLRLRREILLKLYYRTN